MLCKKLNQEPKWFLLKPPYFYSLVFANKNFFRNLTLPLESNIKTHSTSLEDSFYILPPSPVLPRLQARGDMFWASKATPAGGHMATMEPIWGDKDTSIYTGVTPCHTNITLGWLRGAPKRCTKYKIFKNLRDGLFFSIRVGIRINLLQKEDKWLKQYI